MARIIKSAGYEVVLSQGEYETIKDFVRAHGNSDSDLEISSIYAEWTAADDVINEAEEILKDTQK